MMRKRFHFWSIQSDRSRRGFSAEKPHFATCENALAALVNYHLLALGFGLGAAAGVVASATASGVWRLPPELAQLVLSGAGMLGREADAVASGTGVFATAPEC